MKKTLEPIKATENGDPGDNDHGNEKQVIL